MKILILKPSSLGDVVQAVPVLRHLKRHFPQSEIHWWLAAELRPLLDGDPDLAGIIPFERRRWKSPWHWPEMLASIRALRAHRFDWVIDLQGLARSGVFAWLANGSLTAGVLDPREGAAGFYDLAVPRPAYETHAVDWYLAVLARLGVPIAPDFTWLPARPEAIAAVQRQWQPAGERWWILNPGARWFNKRWPVEHFAALVGLAAKSDPALRFAILGGRADAELGEIIAAADPARCVNLAGRTTLPEMVEWIRLSELIVTNDTGPMHVAAALGKPVVALFGPTDARRTGPYGQLASVLRQPLSCAPCMTDSCSRPQPLECLRSLSPMLVWAEARQRLHGTSSPAR